MRPQDISQLAHGQHHRKDSAGLQRLPSRSGGVSSISAGTVVEENRIHSQNCDSCEEVSFSLPT